MTEPRSLEEPVAALDADELPMALVGRAAAYNAAVDAFRDAVRGALDDVLGGQALAVERADVLRACATELVTTRAWLTELARLPIAKRTL